jgi:hypothetical protein
MEILKGQHHKKSVKKPKQKIYKEKFKNIANKFLGSPDQSSCSSYVLKFV